MCEHGMQIKKRVLIRVGFLNLPTPPNDNKKGMFNQ